MEKNVVAVIMAGGLGKRMNSDVPKVLHKIGGISMINRIIQNLITLSYTVHLHEIYIVVGKYKDQIQSSIDEIIELQNILPSAPRVIYITQETPRGTGHAIMCCKDALTTHLNADVLILSGDVPLLSVDTMKRLLSIENEAKLIVTKISDPTGYGRVIVNNGNFNNIIEHKDCNLKQLKIRLINSGIYCIESELLCKYITHLSSNNSQNEYYLTDVIEIIKREEKIEIGLLELESDKNYEIIGVNTIEQLQDLETTLQNIIQ